MRRSRRTPSSLSEESVSVDADLSGIVEQMREFQAERPDDDAGMTARELAAALKIHRITMQERLQQLAAQGRLVAGKRAVRRIDGVSMRVPVYRVKP